MLVKISDLLGNENAGEHLSEATLKKRISQQLCEELEDQFGAATPVPQRVQIVLGKTEPERIFKEAMQWNARIQRDLFGAVNCMLSAYPQSFQIKLGSDQVESVYRVARCASDKFNIFGTYGIALNNGCGFTKFCTILPEHIQKEMHKKPENFAVVTFTAR